MEASGSRTEKTGNKDAGAAGEGLTQFEKKLLADSIKRNKELMDRLSER
jgi:hypothetical protein